MRLRPRLMPSARDRGKQGCALLDGPAAALVGEALREAGPAIYLEQQVGDPGTRQHAIGVLSSPQRLGRRFGLQGRDAQAGLVEHGVGQPAGLGQDSDVCHRRRERVAPCGEVTFHVLLHPDRQRALGAQGREGRLGQQAVLEIAVPPAAPYPHVPGPQPVAQLGQHAHLPGPAVHLAACIHHEGSPAAADEAERRVAGQGALAGPVHVPQQRHRLEQAGGAGRPFKGERLQQRGGELPHGRPPLDELGPHVHRLGPRDLLGLGNGRAGTDPSLRHYPPPRLHPSRPPVRR